MVAAAALFYPHPPVCGVVNAGSVWPWLCVRCCKHCWKKKRPVINLLISVFGFLSPCRSPLVCVHGAQLWLGGWALFLVRLKCIHTRAHTYSAIPQGAPGIIFNCDNESTKKKKKLNSPRSPLGSHKGDESGGLGSISQQISRPENPICSWRQQAVRHLSGPGTITALSDGRVLGGLA